jgi:hypothetical protein
MKIQALIGESQTRTTRFLPPSDVLIDNVTMGTGTSTTKTPHRPFVRQIEYRLVCIGMSVIAYLLERAVLRSITRGGTRP